MKYEIPPRQRPCILLGRNNLFLKFNNCKKAAEFLGVPHLYIHTAARLNAKNPNGEHKCRGLIVYYDDDPTWRRIREFILVDEKL